jgi:hypothetical protein
MIKQLSLTYFVIILAASNLLSQAINLTDEKKIHSLIDKFSENDSCK